MFRDSNQGDRTLRRGIVGAASVVALIVTLFAAGSLVEFVDASEIVLIQYPTGDLSWHTTPGPVAQAFGRVTRYQKRGILRFSADKDEQGNWTNDHRLPVVFNDAGKGLIKGSISYELPMDDKKLTEIHSFYPTQDALESSLVQPALNKSVYMTGPLMTSYESYKERRPQLIQFVEDQVQNGVYQTQTVEHEIQDELNPDLKKRVAVVEIRRHGGVALRQEAGQLARFGVKVFNFAIEDLDYEDRVDQQIAAQQAITMQVQTAIAQAKQAEQRKLTVEAEGAANAADAKWKQETIKAQAVTEAQQRKEVSELDVQAARAEKQAAILRAEGEAEARRLAMSADNALAVKGNLWLEGQKVWASAFANYSGAMVPSVIMGRDSGGLNAVSNAQAFMEIIGIKAARDLGLDLAVSHKVGARAANGQ